MSYKRKPDGLIRDEQTTIRKRGEASGTKEAPEDFSFGDKEIGT